MEISYKLEKFEGPLDLLLHLIERDKINIYDIPIAHITKQYMEYMEQLEKEDLESCSEFLVMAATLIDMKARLLLPGEVDEETGEEIDPRAELVERLLEYKRYKQLAAELTKLEDAAQFLMYKEPDIPKEVLQYRKPVDLDDLLKDVDRGLLQRIYAEVLARKEERVDTERSKFGTIRKERVSLEQTLHSLLHYARKHRRFSFRKLLENSRSKTELVVTFLAVLELMRVGCISLKQEKSFADMEIEAVEGAENEMPDLSALEDK